MVREELARRRWLEKELRHKPKTDGQKGRIARRLRQETTMTLAWIAQRLQMGSVNTLKNTLRLINSRDPFQCWGIKLQICRRMLNLERAGAILSLFIPAVWQEHARSSSPFLQIFWDACDYRTLVGAQGTTLRYERHESNSVLVQFPFEEA